MNPSLKGLVHCPFVAVRGLNGSLPYQYCKRDGMKENQVWKWSIQVYSSWRPYILLSDPSSPSKIKKDINKVWSDKYISTSHWRSEEQLRWLTRHSLHRRLWRIENKVITFQTFHFLLDKFFCFTNLVTLIVLNNFMKKIYWLLILWLLTGNINYKKIDISPDSPNLLMLSPSRG